MQVAELKVITITSLADLKKIDKNCSATIAISRKDLAKSMAKKVRFLI